MPKIPTYDSPQVKSQSMPGVGIRTGGVNPGAFGAEQGEQLQQAGQVLNVVGDNIEKAREQKAISDGMDAANDLQERAMKKQQELQQRAGKDATGIQAEMTKWHDEQQAELTGKLKDPDAQAIFQRNAQKVKLRDMDWAGGYEKQQGDIYHEVTMKTGIENASNAALMNPTRDNVTASIGEIRSYYGELAHRKGYDADWVTANTRQAEQKIHGDILQNAIDQDAVGSVSAYVKEFGDSLDPGLKGKAEKWVHNKVIDETAGAYADTLLGSGVSYSDALAGAREKFSGEDEDKYIRRIKERYGEAQETSRLYAKDAVDRFEKLAYKEGIDKITDEDLDGLAAHDAGIAARWKAERDDYLDKKAAGELYPKYSDPKIVADLNQKLMEKEITSPQQLAVYKGRVSESDYKAAEKSFADNQKVTDTQLEETYMMMAPQTLRDKKEKDWTIEDHNNLFAFKKAAREAVRDNANPDYVGRFSAEWWRKGKVPDSGLIFDDETTKSEAVLSGKPFVPTEDVPVNAITQPGLEADAKRKAHDEALQWLAENPDDPRAADIKARLGL